MEKGILGTVLTITIAVICVATILVPTLSDATKTEETFTNEGYYRMSELGEDESVTYEWASTNPLVLTIDSVDYDMTETLTLANTYFTLLSCDSAYMRVANSSGSALIVQIQKSDGTTVLAFNTADTVYTSVTITVEAGSITFARVSSGSTSTTVEYTDWCYVFDPDGDYVMKYSGTSAYVLENSTVVLMGVTSVNSTSVGIYGYGTVESIALESIYPDDTTVYSNTVIHATESTNYIDLYSLEKVTFNCTRDDVTTQATYSYFLVPYEVTAELSQHLTDAQNNIIMVIPVLMICAILITAVGMLYFRNRD